MKLQFVFFTAFSLLFLNAFSQTDSSFIPTCDTNNPCKTTLKNTVYKPFNQFSYVMNTDVDLKFNLGEVLDREKIDVRLSITNECMVKKQTKIIYEYFKGDSVVLVEETSITDDKKQIWHKGPKSIFKQYLADYSFFYILKPHKKKWNSGCFMRTNDNPFTPEDKWVITKVKYEMTGDTLFSFKGENLNCQKIDVTTKYKKQEYKSYMLFHEKYGFVYVFTRFVNNKYYTLQLVDFVENYCEGKM